MKKVIVLLILLPVITSAQSLNIILQRHFNANKEVKRQELKSVSKTGTIVFPEYEMELETYVNSGKFKQISTLEDRQFKMVIDGADSWMENEFEGDHSPVDMDKGTFESSYLGTRMTGYLFSLKSQGALLERRKNSDTKESFAIFSEDKYAVQRVFYIDKTSYLLRMMETPAGVIFFYNYRWVEGIPFATYLKKSAGGTSYQIRWGMPKLNAVLPDSLFLPKTRTSRQVAEEYLRLFYDLNFEKLKPLLAEDAIWVDASTRVLQSDPDYKTPISEGRTKVIEDLTQGFKGVSTAKLDVKNQFISKDFASFWGIYTYVIPAKYFGGLEDKQALFTFHLPMNTVLRIENGLVKEHHDFADWTEWQNQVRQQSRKLMSEG